MKCWRATGQVAAKSDDLTAERSEWRVPTPLQQGEIYTWTVAAVVDGKEIVSPGASAPEIKFKIVSAHHQQVNETKKMKSHLALGLLYADIGMMSKVRREFQALSRLNPHSKVVANLLRRINL